MAFNYSKSVSYRLAQAAKALRSRSSDHLTGLGLHPGQETVMRLLLSRDGLTMTELASALSVQPPTVTKMVSRLATQGLMRRVSEESDGRRARVYLTDEGRKQATGVDTALQSLEREALAGLTDKESRRLRKLLRRIDRNLTTLLDDQRAAAAQARRTAGVPAASGGKSTAKNAPGKKKRKKKSKG